MAGEQLVVPGPTARAQEVADFTAWVADHHRPLLHFAQLVAGDAPTGEDLLQIALARAYLKWSKISARDEHPLGYVRRIIVNENASLWRRAWKRLERSSSSVPEAGMLDPTSVDTTWEMGESAAVPPKDCGGLAVLRGPQRDRNGRGHGLLSRFGQNSYGTGSGGPIEKSFAYMVCDLAGQCWFSTARYADPIDFVLPNST